MSNDRNRIILIGVALLSLIGLLVYFGFNGRNYNWFEHYRTDSKDPYGTYLVHELLKEHYPENNFNVLTDSVPASDSLGNFIFIGKYFKLDSLKTHRLLNFVEAGSDAFIASKYFQEEFIDTITFSECASLTYIRDTIYYGEPLDYYFQDTLVSLNLKHSILREEEAIDFKFHIRNEAADYRWGYFPYDLICEERTNLTALGEINAGDINFIKVKYGKGNFYLHHTPIAFTNFHLLKKGGLEYAERALSHLEPRPIYWDKIKWKGRRGNGGSGAGSGGGGAGNIFNDSPLKYILSQPALKWAWYTLLGMALLYLIFKAKRRQRIIPVLEKNENTSLEFIGTIGRLHFIDGNHLALSKQKMKLFLGYIRERYHMPTKELNEQFEKHLIDRSEVPEEIVRKIFTIHRNIQSSRFASENILVELHQTMAQFYQKCK